MKIERKKNAIRNAFWGYLSKIISLVMPFIFRTIIIYSLGSDYVGLNSLFTSILQVLSLSELGIGTAIVFNMYKPIARNDNKHISALLNLYKKLYFKIGILILTIGIFITPFLKYLINGSYPTEINIYIVYLAFLLNTVIGYILFGYKSSLINAYQRNDIESKINAIINLLLYAVSSLLIILFKNYYLYLFVLVITTVLNNFILNYLTNKMYPNIKCIGEIENDEKKEIRKNVIALVCHKVGATILNSADNIVISAFLGLTMLAQYTNYYYLMQAMSTLILVCFTGLTGGIGNSFVTESKEKNSDYFSKILFFNGYLAIMFGTILYSVFQDFICVWVGQNLMFDNLVVLLFVIYFFVHSIRRTIIVFRDGVGMWWENRFQPLISAVINLILNIILVKYIGIYGILISTIIAMIVVDIPMEAKVFCKNKINLSEREYIFKLIGYFITLTIACLCVYLINSIINIDIRMKIIVDGIVSLIISNLCIFIVYGRCKEYKYYFNTIIGLVRKCIIRKDK